MIFFEILKEKFISGLLFWLVCLISIVVAFFYQKVITSSVKYSKMHLDRKIVQVLGAFLIVIAPSLFIGFRAYNLNYDTQNYVKGYLNIEYVSSLNDVLENVVNGSPLYFIFRYIIFKLSNGNPTVYLFVFSFITLFILVRGLEKWKSELSLPMALFIYYAFFGMQLLNQSRQMLALSIILFSLHSLLNRKYIKYFTIVIIASLIHFTASIGLIFPLINFKYTRLYPLKKWTFNILLVISPLLFYPIFEFLSFFIPKSYDYYLAKVEYDGIGLGLILNIGPILLPLLIYHRYFKGNDVVFLERMAFLSFPLRLSGYFSYFMMRMYYYGAIASVLLVPITFRRLQNKSVKYRYAIFIIIIYSIYYIVNYLYVDQANIFPYRSIFSQR